MTQHTTSSKSRPLIIGHRGACGYRPDHTLASYELAIEQGVDFVEPDLVMTKDGHLVCRHDVELGGTTDVAEKFPDRKKTTSVDGKQIDDWLAHDFTLAEIQTLRARQPLDFRGHEFDGRWIVPTFVELLELVARKQRELGRVIGVIPELKHSSYHAALGLPLEEPSLRLLAEYGYVDRESPCIIQSFETANLRALAEQTSLRLLQLIDQAHLQPADLAAAGDELTYGQMMEPNGLARVAEYAWGVGPWKESIWPRDAKNHLGQPNHWIENAHRAGLKVVIYTVRSEPRYLAADDNDDPRAEYLRWFKLGIDGLFTDFPDVAIRAWNGFARAV